jgi:hypothetical protein
LIDFLAAMTETMGKIHKRLSNIYENPTMYRCTVGRWVKRVGNGEVGTGYLLDNINNQLNATITVY